MNWQTFFAELKRRNVYRVAVAYSIVSWLLIQIATQVLPFFEVPNWSIRLVVILIVAGLPIALVFAWVFELTPEGLKRTEDVDPAVPAAGKSPIWIYVPIVAALLSIGLFFLGRFTAPTKQSAGNIVSAKSIAVLPFENLSSNQENAYFADGVQDEILTNLARIADLKVISRTSVMQYAKVAARNVREIGNELGVAHLLEATVQRDGTKVRVIAHLIDARNGADVWAQSYDRNLADVFVIQSEIAKTIADQLSAKLSASERVAIEKPPTKDLTAYDLYLRGRALYADTTANIPAREKLPRAASLLEEAVARDPQFMIACVSSPECTAIFTLRVMTIARRATTLRMPRSNPLCVSILMLARLISPLPSITTMVHAVTKTPEVSWALLGARCLTTPKCLNTPVILTGVMVAGRNLPITWNALLSLTRAIFLSFSNWQ